METQKHLIWPVHRMQKYRVSGWEMPCRKKMKADIGLMKQQGTVLRLTRVSTGSFW